MSRRGFFYNLTILPFIKYFRYKKEVIEFDKETMYQRGRTGGLEILKSQNIRLTHIEVPKKY